MKNLLIVVTLLVLSTSAFAGENDTANAAYCKYITEQAAAQRDLLRTPRADIGPTVPSAGTAPQMVVGVTNSLSDDRKASLAMKVAKSGCDLYVATTEAQQHLLYAEPSIEKDVLRHRLGLIDDASNKLDGLIVENTKLVKAQNLTAPAVYVLEAAKVRLDTSRTATLTGITSPYVPQLSDTPLRVLVAEKLRMEAANQITTAKLEKQSSWDVKLSGGMHRQIADITPATTATGGYATFDLTYSLGRHAENKHIEKSIAAYNEWKEMQFDDVARQAAILRQQLVGTVSIQKDQLKTLTSHDAEIAADLQALEGADTSAAIQFRLQLLADRLVLGVEIGDVQYRIGRLQEYLTNNF